LTLANIDQSHYILFDTDSQDILSRYPKFKAVFIKENTELPSSAAIEKHQH